MPPHPPKKITLNRFLVERQREHPEASGRFTRFMGQIGTVAKIISNYMRRAAIEDLLGHTGSENVQGENVKVLDFLGNNVFVEAFEYVDVVGMVVSEEMDDVKLFDDSIEEKAYAVMVDPVDGSSNIDVNGIIGSIFSVHDVIGGVRESCTQKGSEQIAAGYMIYGPSTVLVYTAGYGVHSFVLDHTIGEFVLLSANITMPQRGRIFSANVGNYSNWCDATRAYTDSFMKKDSTGTGKPYTLRYSGALLADLHQILHRGGVYYYPSEASKPHGKLRLLYECAPLAMIAEQAGGAASSGTERIMDINPQAIHQRSPLCIGSQHEVALYERMVAEYAQG